MKSEVKIILEEGSSNKQQGNCFENLIRNILNTHQYDIKSNINFSGMEIDLIASHRHKKETLYVECKAKEKVTSDELTKFCFNVSHKRADAGYFFRTKELEFQAGGLLKELKTDERYNNLTFFEPDEMIKILIDANLIFEPLDKIKQYIIAKKILAVTYLGDFFVYFINEINLLPTKYIIVNAKKNDDTIEVEVIELLKNRIDELENLEEIPVNYAGQKSIVEVNKLTLEIETISEVQESENWYDYLPASSKDFVGREKLRLEIFNFFRDVHKDSIAKRIFYLSGKSGWGKSSMISEIRGRCRNNYYKNKFYTVAIDTRSATSSNFVALAFEKLLESAIKSNFLESTIFNNKIFFTSSVDLLSSDSIQDFLNTLKKQNKVLILIFDQFEDVFRKEGLFKSFYKFLSDITDSKSNIIVGFSWKTEIVIPIENEAYHHWQQAKEQAINISIPEFGSKEVNGIIKQLENSTRKISLDLKRRIIESSQGLPWLTKKLCIHLYKQIKLGISPEKIIDYNLNIESLFKSDLENLTSEELAALKYIAKKAVDGNFFEITDLGENISEETIGSLRDKRLIIRSGANYLIYWDIFRDYLVTNEVQQIGESYILRQSANVCLEVFLSVKDKDFFTIQNIRDNYPRKIKKVTVENILIELRNLGLVQKIEGHEEFTFTKTGFEINREGFRGFVANKFLNYTPYLYINKLPKKFVTISEVTSILKDIFKGYDFQDKTWRTYSKNLIGWFLFTKLNLQFSQSELKKGRRSMQVDEKEHLFIRTSLKKILLELDKIKSGNRPNEYLITDLRAAGIIDLNKNVTDFGVSIIALDIEKRAEILIDYIKKYPKMNIVFEVVRKRPKINAKELLIELPNNFFGLQKQSSKEIYSMNILTWAKKKY